MHETVDADAFSQPLTLESSPVPQRCIAQGEHKNAHSQKASLLALLSCCDRVPGVTAVEEAREEHEDQALVLASFVARKICTWWWE